MIELTEREFAALLRIAIVTLQKWRRAKRVTAIPGGADKGVTLVYPEDAINRFLRAAATNPLRTVTLAQLLAHEGAHHESSLLTMDEAADFLGKAASTLRRHVRQGKLPALVLTPTDTVDGKENNTLRVPVPLLEVYLAELAGPLTVADIVRICGVETRVARTLVDALRLDPAAVTQRGSELVVARENFMALLATLVRNCTAEEWLALREEYNYEELLTASAVTRLYRAGRESVEPRVREWPHLVTPGSTEQHTIVRIPLHVAQAWAATRHSRRRT